MGLVPCWVPAGSLLGHRGYGTFQVRAQTLPFPLTAGVAESVDATDSKSVVRKDVWVRVPPSVPGPGVAEA